MAIYSPSGGVPVVVPVDPPDVGLHRVLGLEVLAAELAGVVDLHVLGLNVAGQVVLLLAGLAAVEAGEQPALWVLPNVVLGLVRVGSAAAITDHSRQRLVPD